MGINQLGQKINNLCFSKQNLTGVKSVFQTNPIHKLSSLKNLSSKKDTFVSNEVQIFANKLKNEYKTSNICINGKNYVKYDGSRMGSNPAFWVQNEEGKLFYIKYAKNVQEQDHLKSEVLASKLYQLAGIDVPKIELCEFKNDSGILSGKIKGIKSEFVTGMKHFRESAEVKDGFAADAWLANWDSLIDNNTVLKNGKILKVDNGGALKYRAQGALKPNFGDRVEELVSLVDGRNPVSLRYYGSMSQEDLVKSFKKVTNISDSDIKDIVKDSNLAKTLINRRNFMCNILEKIQKTPRNKLGMAEYFRQLGV